MCVGGGWWTSEHPSRTIEQSSCVSCVQRWSGGRRWSREWEFLTIVYPHTRMFRLSHLPLGFQRSTLMPPCSRCHWVMETEQIVGHPAPRIHHLAFVSVGLIVHVALSLSGGGPRGGQQVITTILRYEFEQLYRLNASRITLSCNPAHPCIHQPNLTHSKTHQRNGDRRKPPMTIHIRAFPSMTLKTVVDGAGVRSRPLPNTR